ncbi:hypothetical protein KBY58_12170 [Cyanobium sp. HWJ4-Hawea]|uniref:hypothetical protein n=1 Tax=Cyanobium sp. HWJ4-Hawea TaxID=2823713 RepID=UPI0020CE6520|nr:hypothetical protein [Cyanobium sp. HWJ4-Hawea]MCP9810187.1 hypothetical protein [Cyanobium sp. HWJ4-Hawea]
MKKITLALSLIALLQSCSNMTEKVAIRCRQSIQILVDPEISGTSSPPLLSKEEVSHFLIDYTARKVYLFDNSHMIELMNAQIAPLRISFMVPSTDFLNFTNGHFSIDRTNLTMFDGGAFSKRIIGACQKIALPDLTSFGKKI